MIKQPGVPGAPANSDGVKVGESKEMAPKPEGQVSGMGSRWRGVVSLSGGTQWGAQIHDAGTRIWLGTFESEDEAAAAYRRAANDLRGEGSDACLEASGRGPSFNRASSLPKPNVALPAVPASATAKAPVSTNRDRPSSADATREGGICADSILLRPPQVPGAEGEPKPSSTILPTASIPGVSARPGDQAPKGADEAIPEGIPSEGEVTTVGGENKKAKLGGGDLEDEGDDEGKSENSHHSGAVCGRGAEGGEGAVGAEGGVDTTPIPRGVPVSSPAGGASHAVGGAGHHTPGRVAGAHLTRPPGGSFTAVQLALLIHAAQKSGTPVDSIPQTPEEKASMEVAQRIAAGDVGDVTEDGDEMEDLFEKMVTPSDVGKLNRLVIPKQHAERCFPLDLSQEAVARQLVFHDDANNSWHFRYSFWNSSQSYVLTKGWSRFVKEKRLRPGDVMVFQRSNTGKLFIRFKRRPAPPDGMELGWVFTGQGGMMPQHHRMLMAQQQQMVGRMAAGQFPMIVPSMIPGAAGAHPWGLVPATAAGAGGIGYVNSLTGATPQVPLLLSPEELHTLQVHRQQQAQDALRAGGGGSSRSGGGDRPLQLQAAGGVGGSSLSGSKRKAGDGGMKAEGGDGEGMPWSKMARKQMKEHEQQRAMMKLQAAGGSDGRGGGVAAAAALGGFPLGGAGIPPYMMFKPVGGSSGTGRGKQANDSDGGDGSDMSSPEGDGAPGTKLFGVQLQVPWPPLLDSASSDPYASMMAVAGQAGGIPAVVAVPGGGDKSGAAAGGDGGQKHVDDSDGSGGSSPRAGGRDGGEGKGMDNGDDKGKRGAGALAGWMDAAGAGGDAGWSQEMAAKLGCLPPENMSAILSLGGDGSGGSGDGKSSGQQPHSVKCFVEGCPFGVSVDLCRFNSTLQLKKALLESAGGCSVLYLDSEMDMIIMGDEVWDHFKKNVKKLFIRR